MDPANVQAVQTCILILNMRSRKYLACGDPVLLGLGEQMQAVVSYVCYTMQHVVKITWHHRSDGATKQKECRRQRHLQITPSLLEYVSSNHNLIDLQGLPACQGSICLMITKSQI